MAILTPEQRQEIAQAGDQPIRVEDPETHVSYVLVRAEIFERLRTLVDDSEFEVSETLPLGWLKMKEDREAPGSTGGAPRPS